MLKVYRPVRTNKLSQGFNQNKACVRTLPGGEVAQPYTVLGVKSGTCPQGYTPFYQTMGMDGHNGLDHVTWHGEPLYFNVEAPGVRWWARREVDNAGGIGVDIFSNRPIKFDELPKEAGELARREWEKTGGYLYVKFRYWHLKDVVVPNGDVDIGTREIKYHEVKLGDLIGHCDNTGASSGDHLHWSMKFVADQSMTLDSNNGFYGAIDHTPWFENVFVLDVLQVKAQALTAIDLARKAILQLRILLGLV